MLDIKLFREKPDLIRGSEKMRFKDPKLVDRVIRVDNKWRKTIHNMEKLKAERNKVSKEISVLKKTGKSGATKIHAMKKVVQDIKDLQVKADKLIVQRDEVRYTVGNILHKSVPVAKTEEGNEIVRKRGRIPKFKFPIKHQVDLLLDLDLADFDKAAKVSGARFYYLKNELVLLNFSILRYAMDILVKQRFTPLWTPVLMRHEPMKAAAELGDFEEQLYKIQDEDLYLIATSEQTLATFHMNDVFNWKELPKAYTAYSSCFRKEAGSHGKDTKGIFRVHQFDKIEQYVFCHPDESWKWHEKMIKITEDIMKGLEIPYQVVNIASGEMNDNGAKKYDIEGWFPAQNKYRELCSGTNVTDYQARKVNVKFDDRDGQRKVVHTLNCTAVASERTMACLLENNQQKDGSIKIPKALWKYTGFKVIKSK